jgi:PAS domain S-box-containing protein
MNHKQTGRFWRSATQCLLGGIAVALVTLVCFQLKVSVTTAALLYLIVVVLASLAGSFVLSAVVSIIAILCLDYFFTEPLFIIDVTLREPLNLVAVITFLGTALVITSLMAKGRKSFEVLREQASLLNLTHDTVFVRDTSDVITYWNRGAEERYGWKREEAVGKISHQLMQTIFPHRLKKSMRSCSALGAGTGARTHGARRTQVIVASRWSLQRDKQGLPAAILETNNNITEQKRAEEALRQAQAELAHVTRVTTLGELAASIAHEVNQPLSGIMTNSNACIRWLAGDSPNLDEAREAIRRILRDGNRASDVISRIRALVSKTDTEKSRLDVNDAIQELPRLPKVKWEGTRSRYGRS